MAELLGRWATAVDSNLNAYPGALLSTFDSVATTTPKATYSDPELTTPHTNPVVANASGQFPQIFADVGEAFYLVLKTAAGVLVDDFEAVEALGSTGTGTFERDFGAGGRWGVSGALGVVNMEFGPPAGDDIGGDARIGGWDATQGETLEVDFGAVTFKGDVTIDGTLEATGVSSQYFQLLQSGAITAATSVPIPLEATANGYRLEITYLRPSAAALLSLRFAYDAVPTFKSAAADYLHTSVYSVGTPAQVAVNGLGGDTEIELYNFSGTLHSSGWSRFVIDIDGRTGQETIVSFEGHVIGDSNNISNIRLIEGSGGTNAKSYGKPTFVQILASAAVTGRYTLWQKPGM